MKKGSKRVKSVVHCVNFCNQSKQEGLIECFTDFGKLKFLMVALFQGLANFQYFSSCLQK